MNQNSKIYVAGHRGLVGSAIMRRLQSAGHHCKPMAALIRKFHEAQERGDPTVTVWGTGSPRREFLYVEDMAPQNARDKLNQG